MGLDMGLDLFSVLLQFLLYDRIDMQIQENMQMHQQHLDLEIMPIDEHYFLKSTLTLDQASIKALTPQTYIIFVLEIRSGVTPAALLSIKKFLCDSIEQLIQRGLDGISIIINGQHFAVKHLNMIYVKELVFSILNISKEDDYLPTLIKVRHIVQTLSKRIQHKNIALVFFMSYVQIDHTLGVKKISYIDKLNQHAAQCKYQVLHLQKSFKKISQHLSSYILAYDKLGQSTQDYSMADTDLINQIRYYLGNGTVIRDTSITQLQTGFKTITSLIMEIMQRFTIDIPIECAGDNIKGLIVDYSNRDDSDSDDSQDQLKSRQQKIKARQQKLTEQKQQKLMKKLKTQVKILDQKYRWHMIFNLNRTDDVGVYRCQPRYAFAEKTQLSLQRMKNNEFKLFEDKILGQLLKQRGVIYNLFKSSSYREPTVYQSIILHIALYNHQLMHITSRLIYSIISFKRVYDGNGKHHLEMIIDQDLQDRMIEKIFKIDKATKEIHQRIGELKCFERRQCYEEYAYLKGLLDSTQETLMKLHKRQLIDNQVGKLSAAINFPFIKRALRNKLIRRINANPKMLANTYQKIYQICDPLRNDYPQLQAKNRQIKSIAGNCPISSANFVGALKENDCIGLVFELYRPQTAIADPGRIKIRQISPFVMRVSKFFQKYQYGIGYNFNQTRGELNVRQFTNLKSEQYQQMWDYWARISPTKDVALGILPLYICPQHWRVAKLLMKPALGWTVCAQPLGYTFSQMTMVPFMVLSLIIRKCQQIKYQITQIEKQAQQSKKQQQVYKCEQKRNILRSQLGRMEDLKYLVEATCQQIISECSTQKFQQKLSGQIIKKYQQYNKPINRTLDIIPSNQAFISQLYCLIKSKTMQIQTEMHFHQFFKRLVQEELRRQTDGWNQEQTQDAFINKLLNSQIQKMDKPEYVVVDSMYFDLFQKAKEGELIQKTYLEIHRNELEMMVAKGGKFNDTQRLLLIQYKRLYENRVLWLWYVRFLLFGERPRVQIHKWKCLDLQNSYMLFTMIIQNKKQRKNAHRRQAILSNNYVDPFIYADARRYLEGEFMRVRAKKQSQNLKVINSKKYSNATDVFVYSISPQESAGTLINMYVGGRIVMFYDQLVRGKAIKVQQKIAMLMKGEYRGVKLYRGWNIGRKKMNRLRKEYPYEFQLYQWMF